MHSFVYWSRSLPVDCFRLYLYMYTYSCIMSIQHKYKQFAHNHMVSSIPIKYEQFARNHIVSSIPIKYKQFARNHMVSSIPIKYKQFARNHIVSCIPVKYKQFALTGWIDYFASANPFIMWRKNSLDHTDELPIIVHLAECLIGCNHHKWCVVHLRNR